MGRGAAQFLEAHLLAGDRLDDLGPGDEHVGAALDHADEVRQGGGVHRSTGAGTHDERDLWHHSRGVHVAEEDLRVAAEGRDTLLDSRSTGVVEPDEGRAGLHGQVHHLADLVGDRFTQRASDDREVLGEQVDHPAVDAPVPGDHTVPHGPVVLHAEVGAAVPHEHVQFLERRRIAEGFEPLACRELALGVVLLDARGSTGDRCPLAVTLELFDALLCGHGRSSCWAKNGTPGGPPA